MEALKKLAGLWPYAASAAALVGLALLVASLFGGDDGEKAKLPAALTPSDSSWQFGQASLTASSEFLAIADRAFGLAESRQSAREKDLARREAAKEAARRRAREEARRKFEEAKRRAREQYEAALERARRLREKRRAELEARKRELERRRRELERKRRIAPGEECKLPEVRREFDCRVGRL